jgi:hypothetical protein
VVISNNPLSSEYNITVVNYLLSFAAKNSILSKVFFPLVKNQGSILPWENIIFQEKSICRKCHSQTVTLKEVVPPQKVLLQRFSSGILPTKYKIFHFYPSDLSESELVHP